MILKNLTRLLSKSHRTQHKLSIQHLTTTTASTSTPTPTPASEVSKTFRTNNNNNETKNNSENNNTTPAEHQNIASKQYVNIVQHLQKIILLKQPIAGLMATDHLLQRQEERNISETELKATIEKGVSSVVTETDKGRGQICYEYNDVSYVTSEDGIGITTYRKIKNPNQQSKSVEEEPESKLKPEIDMHSENAFEQLQAQANTLFFEVNHLYTHQSMPSSKSLQSSTPTTPTKTPTKTPTTTSSTSPPALILPLEFPHQFLSDIPNHLQPIMLNNMHLRYLCSNDIEAGLQYLESMELQSKNNTIIANGTATATTTATTTTTTQNNTSTHLNLTTYGIVMEALATLERYQDIIDISNRIGDNLNKYVVNTSEYVVNTPRIIYTHKINKLILDARNSYSSNNPTVSKNRKKFNQKLADIVKKEKAWKLLTKVNDDVVDIYLLRNVLQHQLHFIKDSLWVGEQARDIFISSGGFHNVMEKMSHKDYIKDKWWSKQVTKTLQYITDRKEKYQNGLSNTIELKMNIELLNILLEGCVRARDMETAHMLYEEIIDLKYDTNVDRVQENQMLRGYPDSTTTHHLVNSVLKSYGSLKETFLMYQNMNDMNVTPTMETVNMVLRRILKLSGVYGGIEFLNSQTLLHKDIQPDNYTLNFLLNECRYEGQLGAACSLIDNAMKVWGVQPDVISYTCLLQCYSANNSSVGAYSAFQKMIRNNITPDNVAVSRMVQIFAEFGEEKACNDLLIEAHSKKWISDVKILEQLEDMVVEILEYSYDREDDEYDDVDDGDDNKETYEAPPPQQQKSEWGLQRVQEQWKGNDNLYVDQERENENDFGYQNLLTGLPGDNDLLNQTNPDNWLIEEMLSLTPGTGQANALIEERHRINLQSQKLRILLEKDSVKLLELDKDTKSSRFFAARFVKRKKKKKKKQVFNIPQPVPVDFLNP